MSGDLHCHTKLSDGSLGIDDLIVLAQKKGVSTIAIMDHDCLAATVRGKIIGDRHGVKVIPGVELSATDTKRNKNTTVLCYLPDHPDRLEGLCRRNLLARKKASQYMILKASKKYDISPDLILKCATGSTNVYKQHIMHAFMECGLTDRIYGDLYKKIFTGNAPDNITVEPVFPDVTEIINAIHDAGGIAVLAASGTEDNYELLEELTKPGNEGVDGVEVWGPTIDDDRRKHLMSFAEKNNLLMVGGSNFHGMYGDKHTVGDYTTPKQHLDTLLNFKHYNLKYKTQQNG